MDMLLEAIITEPLEKVIEIYQVNQIVDSKLYLDYEILNRSLEFGRLEIADYFLNNNCRVNRNDKEAIVTNTPLHHAVILKDIDIVKRILKRNGSVVAKNSNGDTPLHLAFFKQDVDILDTIFNHIKSFKNEIIENPKNKNGCSHMHIACVRNQVELVKLYLDHGEDVDHAIYDTSPVHAGYTPLHFAVKIGSECIETIQLLLAKGAKPFLEDTTTVSAFDINEERVIDYSLIQYLLTQQNQEKCLPLFHMACLQGNIDYTERFLEMEVDINRPLSSNLALYPSYTPLHFAVLSGVPKCVSQLLLYEADINIYDGNNMTPLHLALYNEKPSDIHKAENIVDILFLNLVDPCIKRTDKNGLSYFHIAVTRNKVDLVHHFLERGYNHVDDKVQRNLRNFSNFTSLHFGVMYGRLDVVKLLLEAKANINCNDNYVHGTPLHMAMEKGDFQMVNLLLDYGASVNVKRVDSQQTPLHLLVLNVLKRPYQLVSENLFAEEDAAVEAIIKRLVIIGGDINLKDVDGNTALHIACSKIRISSNCVKSLLRWGANIDFQNKIEKTPFEISFLDSYRCNAEDYMILYHHIKKLQLLGLVVHEQNIACCKRLLEEKDECDPNSQCFTKEHLMRMHESCLSEIEDLKATKVFMRTSLCHVIWDDLGSLKKRARTSRLRQILETVQTIVEAHDFDRKFPCYGSFVRLWYWIARKYAPEQGSEAKPIQLKAKRKNLNYKSAPRKSSKKDLNNKKDLKNKKDLNNKKEVKLTKKKIVSI